MSEKGKAWDMRRAEQLQSSMTPEEIAALKSKGQADPASLTLDEVGVLFLLTRERIREIERMAGAEGEKR
jgi:DNA-directed RNA polymerase sigma subunit (sigma70/sigma32)